MAGTCSKHQEALRYLREKLHSYKISVQYFVESGHEETRMKGLKANMAMALSAEWAKLDPHQVELRRRLMKELGINQLPDAFKKGWAKAGSEFFIDRDGNRLQLDKEEIFIESDFSEGVATGEDGSGTPCFITDEGKTIFQLYNPATLRMLPFESMDPPSDGASRIKFQGEDAYQFVDLREMKIIEPKTLAVTSFREAREFHEDKVSVKTSDGKWRYMTKDGDLLSNHYDHYAGDFSEGVAWVQMNPLSDSQNTFRLVDADGKFISRTYYKSGAPCSEGLIAAESSDGVYQFIDRHGNLAIEELYENIHYPGFQEGKCAVLKEGSWVFIGIDGKELFGGERFDHIINGFKDGRAAVSKGSDYFFIDEKGNKILGPYNHIYQDFIDGVAQVLDTTVKYIDWYGRDIDRED